MNQMILIIEYFVPFKVGSGRMISLLCNHSFLWTKNIRFHMFLICQINYHYDTVSPMLLIIEKKCDKCIMPMYSVSFSSQN